ncbi:MAG TPA: hypothetical protein VMH83_05185, partial [Candidatus Acidoferrum sp.]|nr:hypothetical protein [Candidatus Acidoferrum sp.]
MAGIDIIAVDSKALRTAFIGLPWQLYRGNPYWVPPLLADEHWLFDKARNPFFVESEADFFLARVNS